MLILCLRRPRSQSTPMRRQSRWCGTISGNWCSICLSLWVQSRWQIYNEIAEQCRKTAETVFLIKNGEGDLVAMDIGTYNRREKMLKLREELLAVEEDRMRGSKGYSVDEAAAMMRNAIKETVSHGTAE